MSDLGGRAAGLVDEWQGRGALQFGWRSEPYAWGVVVLLTIAFTFSMIDRMILTLLVGPLKADFGLSDTEVSLLHGLAFTLLYVTVGLPMGRLADSRSRRAIAGWSIFFWSLMTAACGAASNFTQLFLARVGVGIGEAGLSPAANSLISDYFPHEKLARPIAFFSIGGSAGAGLAYIFGGLVVDYVSTLGTITVPLLGEIRAWQAAFFVVGLPGMAFALCFALVREPERRGRLQSAASSVPVAQVTRFMRHHAAFLVPHFMAAAFAALVILSIHAWMPTFLIRSFGLTAGEAGLRYGIVVLSAGVCGLLFAGSLADRLAMRGQQDAHVSVALGCATVAIVPAILAPLMPGYVAALLLVSVAVFGFAAAIALAPVALQIVVPNEMRGQVYAAYLLTISLLGYTIGPTVVALLTDHIFVSDAHVGRSMATVAALGGPLAAGCFSWSRRRYRALLISVQTARKS